MATTRKNINTASVDNLVDNTFVPDSRDAGVRASGLSQETAVKQKWDVRSIVSYVEHPEASDSLFDAIDALVEKEDKHIPSGEAFVYLLGCDLYHNNEDGKEFLRLRIKDKSTGAEETVALFPGNEYTDRYGMKHDAGHNWRDWAEEVKQQFNARHLPFSAKGGMVQVIKGCVNSGFTTWLLDDGKYLNMYATEKKYLYALKRLAASKEEGNPFQKMLDEATKKDDKAPFDE